MSLNFGKLFTTSVQVLEVALEAEADLQIDIAQIKAGQAATTPPIGGSIDGIPGKFALTFTPNA